MTNPQNEHLRALLLGRGQILPRLKYILKHPAFIVSVVSAGAIAIFVDKLPLAGIKIYNLAETGLTFSSISLGVCFTTAALTLGLPGHQRLSRWSNTDGELPDSSVFTDLLFVVVWSALCQLALILTCTLAIIFGGELHVFPASSGRLQRVMIFSSSLVFFYSLAELFLVLLTFSQLGNIIAIEERKHGPPRKTPFRPHRIRGRYWHF